MKALTTFRYSIHIKTRNVVLKNALNVRETFTQSIKMRPSYVCLFLLYIKFVEIIKNVNGLPIVREINLLN